MIQFGTEKAQKQLERDKLFANREEVEFMAEQIFSLEIGDNAFKGRYIAESLLENLYDEDWATIGSFMVMVFEWIDANHQNHLIPSKYADAYSLVQQLKQLLNGQGEPV